MHHDLIRRPVARIPHGAAALKPSPAEHPLSCADPIEGPGASGWRKIFCVGGMLLGLNAASAWADGPLPDEIFSDGFETGDFSQWTGDAPPPDSFSFCEDFETGTFEAPWTPRPSQPDGLVQVASIIEGIDASYSGTFGAVIGRSHPGDFLINALDLHLDLSGQSNLDLLFWVKDNGDSTDTLDGLYLSDDGGATFQKAYDFTPSNWVNAWGLLPPIDLDRAAADLGMSLSSDFVIRFQQYGFDWIGNRHGFFLDDVKVQTPATRHVPLPFEDGFETGELGEAWHWGDPSITSFGGSILPGGLVEVASNLQGIEVARGGLFGVGMGRRSSGSFTTNALDLHLDLAGEDEVDLSFWVKDLNDATHSVDGLYFSNDGGLTFTKTYDFDPSTWANGVFGRLPPIDVDRLAADAGLALNSEFVIRFQQYGFDDFSGDGIMLDDVSVTRPQVSYAPLPFSDGFEQGSLGVAWTWSDPLYPTSTTLDGTALPGGLVEVASSVQGFEVPRLGNFGVALGRRATGAFTTNALDLHLDLSGRSQVELRFWLKDRNDGTHTQDAIYFSSNGGESFRRVFSLDPSSISNDVYQEFVLDVDLLASGVGISLSDRFVIRFQQYGFDDFSGDGFMIDDVSVVSP